MSLPVARCPLPLPLFTKPLLSGASCLVIVIIVILSSRCSFPLPNGYPPVCAVLGSRCRISFIDATSLPLQLQLQLQIRLRFCQLEGNCASKQANRQNRHIHFALVAVVWTRCRHSLALCLDSSTIHIHPHYRALPFTNLAHILLSYLCRPQTQNSLQECTQ